MENKAQINDFNSPSTSITSNSQREQSSIKQQESKEIQENISLLKKFSDDIDKFMSLAIDMEETEWECIIKGGDLKNKESNQVITNLKTFVGVLNSKDLLEKDYKNLTEDNKFLLYLPTTKNIENIILGQEKRLKSESDLEDKIAQYPQQKSKLENNETLEQFKENYYENKIKDLSIMKKDIQNSQWLNKIKNKEEYIEGIKKFIRKFSDENGEIANNDNFQRKCKKEMFNELFNEKNDLLQNEIENYKKQTEKDKKFLQEYMNSVIDEKYLSNEQKEKEPQKLKLFATDIFKKYQISIGDMIKEVKFFQDTLLNKDVVSNYGNNQFKDMTEKK